MDVNSGAGSIIPGLPDEVVLGILLRFRHPQLARLRCVCRAWKLALDPATMSPLRRSLNFSDVWPVFVSHHAYDSLFTLVGAFSACSYRITLPPVLAGNPSHAGLPHQDLSLGVVGLVGTMVLIAAMPKITHAMPSSSMSDQSEVESLNLQLGLYSFDVASMKWGNSRYSSLPTTLLRMKVEQPYEHVIAADTDGCYLYVAEVFGRYHGLLKGVERLDLTTRTWETLPKPLAKRKGAVGVVLHGCFCLIGGWFDRLQTRIHNSGEIWNPENREWTLVPALWPSEVFGKCFVASKVAMVMDQLYALRRGTILEELMYYASSSETWISLGYVPMVLPSSDKVRLLGLGQELWVVGDDGMSCLVTNTTLPQQLSWRFAPNFSRGRLYADLMGILLV